jgi:hypothetical protein
MENMKPKIENVKINGIRRADSAIHAFIEVLKELEVGQSFTYDLKSNHRLAIQIAARCSRIASRGTGLIHLLSLYLVSREMGYSKYRERTRMNAATI